MLRIALVALCLVWICNGAKIDDCPVQMGLSYFIADDTDPCVYHWCLNGELMMEKPFGCPVGTGVPRGYRGPKSPCSEVNSECARNSTAKSQPNKENKKENVKIQQTFKKVEPKQGKEKSRKKGKILAITITSLLKNGKTSKTKIASRKEETIPVKKVKVTRRAPEAKSWGWQQPSVQQSYGNNLYQPALAPPPVYGSYGYAPAAVPAANVYGYAAAPAYPAYHQPYYQQHHVYVNVPDPATTVTTAAPDTTTSTSTTSTTTTAAGPTPAPVTPSTATPVQVNIPYGYGSHGFGLRRPFGGGFHGQHNSGGNGYFAATAWLTKNANIPGGTLQSHVHSLKFCWRACVHSLDCKGFDYDVHHGTCWLHTTSTICNALQANAKVQNYRLIHCASTTGATTTTAGSNVVTSAGGVVVSTTPGFTSGQHILGGTLQTSITSRASCLSTCASFPQMTCSGVDFDTTNNMCFFHSNLTECNALTAMAGTEHYRFISCATATCTAASFTTYPVAHILGGSLQNGINTQPGCQTACCNNPSCAGYDFNTGDMSCWLHTSATCSGSIIIKANCMHYSRTDVCPSAPVLG